MTAPCPRCGNRSTTPLTGHAHHCPSCHRDFGFADQKQATDAADAVRKLHFYIGGFYGPSYEIYLSAGKFSIKTWEAEVLPIVDPGEPFLHTPTRFKRIIRRLFRHYHVADWNREYNAPVCDGTQWELTLHLNDKRRLRFHGSNAYPPRFRHLLRLLAPYFRAEGVAFSTNI